MSFRGLVLISLLFIAPALPASSQEQARPPLYEGTGGRWKELFKKKEKGPEEEEKLYKKALSLYEGRPTWLARRFPGKAKNAKNSRCRRPFYYRIDYEKSIELFQKLVYEFPFTKHLADADFYIAECHYKLKDYDIALTAYQDFLVRHPRDPRIEHVYFQIGMSHWQQRKKKPLRDQTQTEAAVEAFKTLLQFYPATSYQQDAEKYIDLGNKILVEREVRIGDFYFSKKEYWSASLRYHTARTEYPQTTRAQYAAYQEGICFLKLNRKDQAAKLFREFLDSYPQSEYAKEAKNKVEKLQNYESMPAK